MAFSQYSTSGICPDHFRISLAHFFDCLFRKERASSSSWLRPAMDINATSEAGRTRGQFPAAPPQAHPGGCVSDGADPESTYVERVWLCLGMIPPSSGQEHSCQHQRRSERSAPRGLTLTRSGNRSELLSSSIARRGPRGAWQQNPRIQPPALQLDRGHV